MANSINFYCVYVMTKNDTIILENADEKYLRMTGLKKCGGNISDIYRDEYANFISDIYNTLLPGESMRFIRNNPSDLCYVTVLRDRDYLRCVGVPIENADFQLRARANGSCAYAGTIEAEKQNGIYIITDISSKIPFYFPEIKKGAELEKAVQMHTYPKHLFYMPEIGSEEPLEISVPLKICEKGRMWNCKMNIAPIFSDDRQKLIITLTRAVSEEIYGTSFCELHSDGNNIRISKMDNDFAALIAEGNINPEEIFQNIRSYSQRDSELTSKLRDIKNGGDRTFYSLRTDSGCFTGAVISTPKPLPNSKLSEREFEVLTLSAKGNTIRYIACLLGVKEGTVKRTLHNGFVKLGISSKAELTDIYRNSSNSLKKYRQT